MASCAFVGLFFPEFWSDKKVLFCSTTWIIFDCKIKNTGKKLSGKTPPILLFFKFGSKTNEFGWKRSEEIRK